MEAIYLNKDDIKNLKKVGKGTEGEVYKKDRNTLYKIYTRPLNSEDSINYINNNNLDEFGVRINDKSTKVYNNFEPYPYYLDDNGIKKVYDENVIFEAIKRQKNVFMSDLPKAPIYVDGKFDGCVIKKHNFSTDLHNTSFLPIRKKLQILKELLEKVKELTDNYIYTVDLANYKRDNISHSNILVNIFNFNTNIIDLDGKSTVYSKDFNYNLYKKCYICYSSLVMKYLYEYDTYDEIMDIEYDYIIGKLIEKTKLDYNSIVDILDYNVNTYEKNNKLLSKIKRVN